MPGVSELGDDLWGHGLKLQQSFISERLDTCALAEAGEMQQEALALCCYGGLAFSPLCLLDGAIMGLNIEGLLNVSHSPLSLLSEVQSPFKK